MPIDIFDIIVMTEALNRNLPPKMFLTDTFFSVVETHPSKEIQFDVVKGKRRMAPFVSRSAEGRIVEGSTIQTNSIIPPYLKPKKVTIAEELLKRMPGEPVYVGAASMSPEERAARKLAEDLTELQQIIDRRIEWMAAKGLFTGIVPVQGDGVDYQIDFLYGADQKKTLTGAARWTESTADPIKDYTDWSRQIKQLTGRVPRVSVLGRNSANSLVNSAKVRALLDNRRTEAGMLRFEDLPSGAQYIGFLSKPGIELFTYDEWYLDPATDTEVEMVPENMVLLGATDALNRLHFGAISDIDAGTMVAQSFAKSWTVPDPSVRYVMAQSAPLPAIQEPEAFVVATVQDPE